MIGILGGMGTQAGLDFCNKLAVLNRGKIDQEYPLFLLYNKSNIPGSPESIGSQTKKLSNRSTNKISRGKRMKNVFKRCLNLLTLFSSNIETFTTNFIKDNVAEYRELGDSAFKRSFERDKALLKEMGFLLDFENDKWKINDGYKLTGTKIFDDIKSKGSINIENFINTYQVIKQFFNSDYKLDSRNIYISKIIQAIDEKRRISFKYKSSLRKIYPLGLKQYDNQWVIFLLMFNLEKLTILMILKWAQNLIYMILN